MEVILYWSWLWRENECFIWGLNYCKLIFYVTFFSNQTNSTCRLLNWRLGPLLFTLFFNDFVDHVPNSKVIMYADDTVIYVEDKDANKIEQCLNEDQRNISDYYRKSKLIINLNKGKTELMLFGSAQLLKTHDKLLQVIYKGHTINFFTEFKYLGTVIDSHLTLNDNFDKAYKEVSSCLRHLHRLRSYLTVEAACNVYSMMLYLW